ncbi:TRAP transporter large permease subunit [Candidatus Haliotispira prima]|uniref:TRAP transporter large permease subunit n=1 Tax=Candidatus Haliotispira prima TaxID=3034016 RepID=A0ABY8MDT1_9SPIO|nr:TRAP transporter large permease subunit [Candidatus Haliotispira prima]
MSAGSLNTLELGYLRPVAKWLRCFEDLGNVVVVCLLFTLPLLEIILRNLFHLPGLYGSEQYSGHLLFILALSAGLYTQRQHMHLGLSIINIHLPFGWQRVLSSVKLFWATVILLMIGISSWVFLESFVGEEMIGVIPLRLILYLFPLSIGLFILRLMLGTSPVVSEEAPLPRWLRVLLVIAGIALAWYLSQISILHYYMNDINLSFEEQEKLFVREDLLFSGFAKIGYWLIGFTLLLFLLGFPIFLTLAGVSYVLFNLNFGQVELIPNAFYTLFTGEGNLNSLPLFALAGFILSEGNSSKRLVDFFQHLCRNLPGGIGIVVIVTSTFFTVVTGASGITILALGGLLYSIMQKAGYSKGFSIGLLTTCGSVGLLFPPSLPIIIYGTKVGVSIKSLFLAGLLPGLLITFVLCVLVVWQARKQSRKPVIADQSSRALLHKGWVAAGELLLPLFIFLAYFYFKVTAREISALTVCYALILNLVIHRDYGLRRLPTIFRNLFMTMGGILLVIGFARSYSDHFVFFNFHGFLQNYITNHIESSFGFLFLVNVVLLLAGCFLDIFSAIYILAPLISSLGEIFMIPAEQLGIIFLFNLELGYITPPVGLSLFLASYRFRVPLLKIYRYVVPFFLISLVLVLLVTYVPWLSTWLPSLFP